MRVLLNFESKYESLLPRLMDELRKYGATQVVSSTSALTTEALGIRIHQFEIDRVIICHPRTKPQLLKEMGRIKGAKNEKLNDEDWAGSVLNICATPVMLASDLRYWFSKPYAQFVFATHAKKLLVHTKEKLLDRSKYSFTFVNRYNHVECLASISTSLMTAIDIETTKHHRMIMSGYSCLLPDGTIRTYVVDLRKQVDTETLIILFQFIKDANLTKAPKVFHNGTYDNQYFASYGFPVYNWTLDTEYLFYSLYAELPRKLSFVTAFYLPTSEFWKDTMGEDMPRYNALDCYNTLQACIAMLTQVDANGNVGFPAYATKNYQKVFPLSTPCLWSAFQGLNVDKEELDKSRWTDDQARAAMQKELDTMCGLSEAEQASGMTLNVNSPKTIPTLFYGLLGAKKIRVGRAIANGCPELVLEKISEQHPIIRRFATLVTAIRKKRKAISTYYDALMFSSGGTLRLLWSYRIDGTETGRLSCKQSNFGPNDKQSYGGQVQNIPVYMKSALIADEGYILFEKDYSQSEARCVAYLANDPELIRAFEISDETEDGDFYNECGNLFFGILPHLVPKLLRNKVIKKIIHGSNYMMKGQTFVDNAGKKNLVDGMATLAKAHPEKGIQNMSILHFGNYLLTLYHRAYPKVRDWYDDIAVMLRTTARHTSLLGWTRIFFSDPYSDATLRSAVAHQPQNLSVSLINNAVVLVFWEVQVKSNGEYKFIAQVHDSILQQCVEGKEEYYMDRVQKIMEQPVTFPSGKTMLIPVDGNADKCWKKCH